MIREGHRRIGAMIRRDIPPPAVARHAVELDPHFDELLIVEDLPFAGGISQLTTVLAATSRALVSHGIAPAPFRNVAALAMEWATLAEMYPGRLVAGIGHGVQPWMRSIGASVESPLTLLREQLDACRALLRGETISVAGRYVQMAGIALEFPPKRPPHVVAGVGGPKSLFLSGECADGTMLAEDVGPDDLQEALRHVDAGRRSVGRTDPHDVTVLANIAFRSAGAERSPRPGWIAAGDSAESVAHQLNGFFSAGADSVVLVPTGPEPRHELNVAATEIVPILRELIAGRNK